jgi:hypothetical protein
LSRINVLNGDDVYILLGNGLDDELSRINVLNGGEGELYVVCGADELYGASDAGELYVD